MLFSLVMQSSTLRSKDRNILLYNESARPLPVGQLAQYKDVDLAVESHRAEGRTEKKAVQAVAEEIITQWTDLTTIKVSHLSSVIRKINGLRNARAAKLKNPARDGSKVATSVESNRKGAGKERKSSCSKLDLHQVSKQLFDIRALNAEVGPHDKAFLEDQVGPRVIHRFVKKVSGAGDDEFAEPDKLNNNTGNSKSNGTVGGTVEPEPEPGSSTDLDDANAAQSSQSSSSSNDESSNSSSDEEEAIDDPDYEGCKVASAKTRPQKIVEPQLFELGERHGFSASALMDVHNLYSDPENKISKSGILGKRKSARLDAAIPDFSDIQVEALGFDERKDQVRSATGEMIVEEHVAVILYPGNLYAGHFAPEKGDAKSVAKGLLEFCSERNICLDNLKALVSDGCEKMVGWRKGLHSSVEKELKRPLQRCLCYFHHLENGFKAVFEFYGYDSKGPTSLGPLWNPLINLDSLHKEKTVKFKVLPNPELLEILESMDTSEFSNDHQIFFGLLMVVLTGIENSFVWRKIGPVVLSRFATTETRALRKYISTENPSYELQRMVHFIVYVWGHMYIVSKPHQEHSFSGPSLLLQETQLAKKYLNEAEFEVFLGSLNYNGEYAHPENVLLGLLCSKSKDERELGVEIILKIRNTPQPKRRGRAPGPRKFKRCDWEINPDCNSLSTLCKKPLELACTEPPYTMAMTDMQIQSIVDEPLLVAGIPLTTVSVERAIKEVTRASKLASTCLERDGVIQQTLKARMKRK